MTAPPAIKTQVPLPGDAPGLGYSSQTWLPQVQAYQNAESGLVSAQTASFTVGLNMFYPVDATAGNLVVTLPKATAQWRKPYVIKKIDSSANTITITADTTVPDKIDGAATVVISLQYHTVYIVSDGVKNWWLVQNIVPTPVTNIPGPTIYTTGSGNFTTSATTTLIKVVLQAAGGNGGSSQNLTEKACGGGGSGEYAEYIIPVSANTAYSYAVGAVGANTTFNVGSVVYTAAFGVSGVNGSGGVSQAGGAGGGRSGPAGGGIGNPGAPGASGVSEGAAGETGAISGASGGGATTTAAAAGGKGGANGSFNGGLGGAGSFFNGGGGAASFFGPGGTGGAGTASTTGAVGGNAISTAYGAGGGGAAGGTGSGVLAGGTGTGGCIIIIPLD